MRSHYKRGGTHGLLLAGTLLLAGCSQGITVREVNRPALSDSWRSSAITCGEPSPRTWQTLYALDLANQYKQQPVSAIHSLHALAVQTPSSDLLFALAELSYLNGLKSEKADKTQAVASYYLCAGYAYHYLFSGDCPVPRAGEVLRPPERIFDPRFRLACDLYNTGLAKCIDHAQKVGRLDPRQKLYLPSSDGRGFELSVDHLGFPWRPDEFGPLRFCANYQVVGLQNQHRSFGLGVPLIGQRVAAVPAPGDAFYPPEVSFPVTAFFRFEGTVADLGGQRSGKLELYNPLTVERVVVQNRAVPLETDLTTPLAYFLSRTDLEGLELRGLFRPVDLANRTGIYLFEPYQKGKIPVVMVHGLLSSPLTWTTMFNDLRADPVLRERYQFWFYLYPTGNPFLTAAADLRQALYRLRNEVDPRHQDGAFDQMVMVGHSMGGLVSKVLTQDSGNDFWKLVSNEPFQQLKAELETKQEFQRLFFFDEQPSVRRVIFLATPHHGSGLSPGLPGQLAIKFIQLPQKMISAAQDLAKENPGAPAGKEISRYRRLPTSIDLLAPGDPALELLAARTAPPGVLFHSVVGISSGKAPTGSDGVVPYESAHLEGAASEIIVPADHMNVHHHPRAVLEVRRILLEHLRSLEQRPAIVPVLGHPQ
jgi:pimeloyl-ACP methyl ester carboxylesterase